MSRGSFDWSMKKWCWGAACIAPLVFLCERYLDMPLALLVQQRLYGNLDWARHTSNLPDLLLPVVLVTTLLAVPLYLVRKRRRLHDRITLCLLLMAWTAPVSYLVKGGLKQLFGRVNTRVWLREPELYGFHWFDGGSGFEGFPSGHMLVLVALAAVMWRFFPRQRFFWGGLAVLLALALLATNYHFLSDVLAGGYLALGVEGALFRIIVAGSDQPAGCGGGSRRG